MHRINGTLKRMLTGLLAAAMIVTALPAQAFAEEIPQEDAAVTVFETAESVEETADEAAELMITEPAEEEAPEVAEPEAAEADETLEDVSADEDMPAEAEAEVPEEIEADPAEEEFLTCELDDILYPEEDYVDEEIPEEDEETEDYYLTGEYLGAASGEEPGTNIKWSYTDDGTLTLSGSGATRNYKKNGDGSPSTSDRPWRAYSGQVTKLVVCEGITRLGDRAMQNFQNLEVVSLPDSLESLGIWAFQNCYALTDVNLSDSVVLDNTGVFGNTPFNEDLAATENDIYKSSSYYTALLQTELTGNYRDDVIAIARSQIGYHEGDSEADYGGGNTKGEGDVSEYGRFLGSSGNAWCSEFASWCIRMAGVPTSLVNSSKGANANTFTADTTAAYHPWSDTVWGGGSYTPGKGDVILWVWRNYSGTYAPDQSLSHTTLLESVEDNGSSVTFNVVHGNSGNAVGIGRYEVNKADGKLYDDKGYVGYVGYFVAPDYENTGVIKSTVTFDANGGTITGQTSKRVAKGGMYGPLPLVAKKGQDFLGWFNANGKRIRMYSPIRLEEGETLKAHWQAEAASPIPLQYLRPGAVASSVKVYDKTMEEKQLGTNAYGQLYSYLADGKQYVALYVFGTQNNAVLNNQGIISDSLYGNIAKTTVTDIIMDDHIGKIAGTFYFQEMSKVTYVRLSENLTEMGGGCFADCESLPEITIPKKLEYVSAMGTFSRCKALKKVTFESGIKKIPDYICQVNSEFESGHIETVLIPPSVTEIGVKAFEQQKDLTTVIFTDPAKTTLARVGNSAFQGTNLSGIVLPKFGGTWTDPAPPTWKMDPVIEDGAFNGIGNKNFTTLIIPEGVKKLGSLPGEGSFLKEIYLPKSLVEEGFYNIFAGLHYMDTFDVLKIYYPGTEAEFYRKYGDTKQSLLSYGNQWVNKMHFGIAAPAQVSSITADAASIVRIYDDMTGSESVPVTLTIGPANHLPDTEYSVKTTDETIAAGVLSGEANGQMTLTLTIWKKIGTATVTVSGGTGTVQIHVTVKEKERAEKPYVIPVTGNGEGYGDLIALRSKTVDAQIFYAVDNTEGKNSTLFNTPDNLIKWDASAKRYKTKTTTIKEYTQPLVIGTDISASGHIIHAIAVGKDLKYSGILHEDRPYPTGNPWGEIDPDDKVTEFYSSTAYLYEDSGCKELKGAYKGLWIPKSQFKNLVYTGKAVTIPDLRVYYGTKRLDSRSDYTLKYNNNVNASTNASVTVTLKGNYSGKQEFPFTIGKYTFGSKDITFSYPEVKEKKVKGVSADQKPDPKVTIIATGKVLKPGVDYTLKYVKDGTNRDAVNEPGRYQILISSAKDSNYRFSSSSLLTGGVYCLGDNNISLSKVTVSSIPAQDITDPEWKTDGGYQVKPGADDFSVTYKGETLNVGEQFKILKYMNNTAVGKASVVLLGMGDTYYGTKTVTFQIKGIAFNKTNVQIEGIQAKYPYTGSAVVPAYRLKYGTELLAENKDYTVSYAKNGNTDAGTVNMTFTGAGRFTGSLKASYKIDPVDASKVDIKGWDEKEKTWTEWVDSEKHCKYLKNGVQPAFSCKFGTIPLVAGKDYTVKYNNNKAAGDFNAMKGKNYVGPSFTITFKGNYTGKATQYFTIDRLSIDKLHMSLEDMVYVNTANKFARKPVITDANGTVLKAGTDYKKDFVYKYATTTKNVTVVTGKGKNAVTQKIDRQAGEEVQATDILPVGTAINVYVEGMNNYYGTLFDSFKVAAAGVKDLKFIIEETFTYTGDPITPGTGSIKVQKKNGRVFEDVPDAEAPYYYDIIGYSNNVKKGTGKITLKAKNGYAGTTTVSFKIVSP
ncbi:MAG: leucine-rich repeat protein [Lachnospiraceae bacterium]|nr:leucine-rich repeat protein [Lachnospiraceae bacterium]